MVSPATGGLLKFGVAVAFKSMDIVRLAVTVTLAELDVTAPKDAVAMLVSEPASMSDCVTACVEEQVIEAPGASGPVPHGIVPCLSSVTVKGAASVVFPLLVTMYVEVITGVTTF